MTGNSPQSLDIAILHPISPKCTPKKALHSLNLKAGVFVLKLGLVSKYITTCVRRTQVVFLFDKKGPLFMRSGPIINGSVTG